MVLCRTHHFSNIAAFLVVLFEFSVIFLINSTLISLLKLFLHFLHIQSSYTINILVSLADSFSFPLCLNFGVPQGSISPWFSHLFCPFPKTVIASNLMGLNTVYIGSQISLFLSLQTCISRYLQTCISRYLLDMSNGHP